jgi:hypothetical protein
MSQVTSKSESGGDDMIIDMAVVGIALDKQPHASQLWVCLVRVEKDETEPMDLDSVWIRSAYLPRTLESAPFPKCANKVMLSVPEDVYRDWLDKIKDGSTYTQMWVQQMSKPKSSRSRSTGAKDENSQTEETTYTLSSDIEGCRTPKSQGTTRRRSSSANNRSSGENKKPKVTVASQPAGKPDTMLSLVKEFPTIDADSEKEELRRKLLEFETEKRLRQSLEEEYKLLGQKQKKKKMELKSRQKRKKEARKQEAKIQQEELRAKLEAQQTMMQAKLDTAQNEHKDNLKAQIADLQKRADRMTDSMTSYAPALPMQQFAPPSGYNQYAVGGYGYYQQHPHQNQQQLYQHLQIPQQQQRQLQLQSISPQQQQIQYQLPSPQQPPQGGNPYDQHPGPQYDQHPGRQYGDPSMHYAHTSGPLWYSDPHLPGAPYHRNAQSHYNWADGTQQNVHQHQLQQQLSTQSVRVSDPKLLVKHEADNHNTETDDAASGSD